MIAAMGAGRQIIKIVGSGIESRMQNILLRAVLWEGLQSIKSTEYKINLISSAYAHRSYIGCYFIAITVIS